LDDDVLRIHPVKNVPKVVRLDQLNKESFLEDDIGRSPPAIESIEVY
jgi:hypothetical protein